jgi:sulfate adenylyltransferase subunit 1
MYSLENLKINNDLNYDDPRFPVQYVIRPNDDAFHDYRGYAGRVAGGVFHKGDSVRILPSGLSSTILSIDTMNGPLDSAFPPQSVTITLKDDLDISRGDMIVKEDRLPQSGQDITAMICWLNEQPMRPGSKYWIRHTTKEAKCIVQDVKFKVDINTLSEDKSDHHIGLNDIAQITIRTAQPLFFDSYRTNRITGSFILIDEGTNETVCSGMIL